jgi:hypothetical protein
MNVTSVSGFKPFFRTAAPIDPIKPSKFSRKKPGWRILPCHHVSATFLFSSEHVLTSNSAPLHQALCNDSRHFSSLSATALVYFHILGPAASRSNTRRSRRRTRGRHLRDSITASIVNTSFEFKFSHKNKRRKMKRRPKLHNSSKAERGRSRGRAGRGGRRKRPRIYIPAIK